MPLPARITTCSLALLLLFVAAGCGSNSFLGQRFDNFTAYYNTFYNALAAYEQGRQAMEGSTEPVDRTQFLTIFGGPARAGGNVSFQNAIEKSADVLREHPNSKWVDDALFLIGKSYFYQSNYVGAEQKFREVIELATPLEGEARLWLARTLIEAGSFTEARSHLVTSLEQEDVSDHWRSRLHLALGELYVRQKAFEDAAQELATGLEDIRDNEIEARASFLLGQVQETLGRYDNAVESYRKVEKANPPYELSYAANLSAARVEGLHLDASAALDELRRMERDGKNYDNRFEIAFFRGRIYHERGRAQDARSLYHEILRDPNAQRGGLSGRLHYALAELYRDEFEDYLIASAHFDTARTSFSSNAVSARAGSAVITLRGAPEAVADVQEQAEVFRSFADVRRRVARMDSLLELGSLSPAEFEERILEMQRRKAEELAEERRRAQQLQAAQGFQDTQAGAINQGLSSPAGQSSGEAGFLFHRDPIRVQEARTHFVARWGERPRVPNWRRSDAVATADRAESTGPLVGADLAGVDRAAQSAELPPIDYSDVPRDSSAQARMESERALARYELANVLFLSMNHPDSAAVWYRLVVQEDADEEVAQRAFYALAEVQRSLGDSSAATRLFEQVLRDYPQSEFADRVRERLGIQEVVPSDHLTIAWADYDAAFKRWREGSYGAALDGMVAVAARHVRTDVAPKALLAAGRIYLEWANSESLDVFGPLPLTLSDSVIQDAGLRRGRKPSADSTASEQHTPSPILVPEDGEADGSAEPRRRLEPEASHDLRDLEVPDRNAEAVPDRVAELLDRGAEASETAGDLGAADTTAAGLPPVDTTAAGLPPPDTTAAGFAAPDTAVLITSADDEAYYLPSLYIGVLDQYPSTPYAEQAEYMLDRLERRRRALEAARDSADVLLAATFRLGVVGSLAAGTLFAALPDSGVADSTAAVAPASQTDSLTADSTTAIEPAASVITEERVDSVVPSGDASLHGEGGIKPELGGFTIILDLNVEREPMDALVQKHAEEGFRAEVIEMTVDGMILYRAAIGHFPTMEAASAALTSIQAEFDGPAQVVPLSDP